MWWGFLICLVGFAAGPIDSIPNPRVGNGWVSDTAGVVDAAQENALNGIIDQVHQETGAEITVVTVAQVEGTPKAFATALFNHWGIGDAQANNGLLVLLVVDARRLEMETGYGLDAVLSDGWLGTMQAQTMVPLFKAGAYGAGLVAGVKRISVRMQEDAGTVRDGGPGMGIPQTPGTGLGLGVVWVILLAGTGGCVVWWCVVLYRRNRSCDTCGGRMVQLDEATEDDFLDDAQELEESLDSVDWRVFQCPSCAEVKRFGHRRWFRPFKDCGSCGRRTSREEKDVLRHATTFSGGLVEVQTTCAYCGHETKVQYRTARNAGSIGAGVGGGFGASSGGGGSFGGGSSGGGGAGSSW